MNLDIKNYEYYRISSHGGRSYDLFNRNSDKVISLSKEEYNYINNHKEPIVACKNVEGWKKK